MGSPKGERAGCERIKSAVVSIPACNVCARIEGVRPETAGLSRLSARLGSDILKFCWQSAIKPSDCVDSEL